MTIKRRLFISNILMIVIPLIAYMILAGATSIAVVKMHNNNPDLPMLHEEYFKNSFSDYPNYIFLITIFWLAMFAIIAIIVFITGHRLAHAMTKNIITPLNTLVFGVTQIRDNNFSFRINYHAEDEFRPVCEAFNEMAARLETMTAERQKDEESRRELIAGISHDLRTPLTSIKAYLEGIETGVASTPEQRQKYFSTIQNKVNDLEHIINQLFLFSKLETSEFPVNEQKIEIGKFLIELAKELTCEYEQRGLALIIGGVIQDKYVSIDTVLFRSVIINILENSVKYKLVKQGRIKIEWSVSGETAEIRLTDNGPGVPEDVLEKLFDVFYRADPSRSTKGSGLGLAISKKIINLMGGSMSAGLSKRRSLVIVIRLPIASGSES